MLLAPINQHYLKVYWQHTQANSTRPPAQWDHSVHTALSVGYSCDGSCNADLFHYQTPVRGSVRDKSISNHLDQGLHQEPFRQRVHSPTSKPFFRLNP